jgi:isopentenyldiphosphate isomerase
MEYVDVLDENGVLTGSSISKKEAHKTGAWHKAVHIWILNSVGELLLQKRSPTKDSHPNQWDISAAGHVSAGESSIISALREIEEEIGVTLEQYQLEYLFTLKAQSRKKDGTYINNEFNDVYLVKLDLDISKLQLQEEEVSEIKYISYKELQKKVNSKDESLVPHDEQYRRLFEILNQRVK